MHFSLCDAREFSNERGRVERRAQFQKYRSRQMFTEAMSAYLDWITKAGLWSCRKEFIYITSLIKNDIASKDSVECRLI